MELSDRGSARISKLVVELLYCDNFDIERIKISWRAWYSAVRCSNPTLHGIGEVLMYRMQYYFFLWHLRLCLLLCWTHLNIILSYLVHLLLENQTLTCLFLLFYFIVFLHIYLISCIGRDIVQYAAPSKQRTALYHTNPYTYMLASYLTSKLSTSQSWRLVILLTYAFWTWILTAGREWKKN